MSITGTQFRRLQELSFVDYRNSVLSITGTQFRRLQELSFVNYRNSVSSITGNQFRQFRFVSFVSSITGNQFRFVEYRKPYFQASVTLLKNHSASKRACLGRSSVGQQ